MERATCALAHFPISCSPTTVTYSYHKSIIRQNRRPLTSLLSPSSIQTSPRKCLPISGASFLLSNLYYTVQLENSVQWSMNEQMRILILMNTQNHTAGVDNIHGENFCWFFSLCIINYPKIKSTFVPAFGGHYSVK